MTDRKASLWLAVLGTCLLPGVAAAQTQQQPDAAALVEKGLAARPDLGRTSEIEAGVGFNTENSGKFGEYTGLNEDGPFGIGSIDVQQRAPFNSESSQYWEISGTNLGLDSRALHLEYGQQGLFDLFLDYDQTPRNQIDHARTPYIGEGTGRLTLPAGLMNSGTSSATIVGLDEALRPIDIETERKDLGGGITWHLSPEWSVKGKYAHEFKEGTDTIAGIFGENGGNPLASILPQPIDYEEDRVDVGLAYAGERLQVELSYEGSWFTNNESSLRWDNPFTNATWDVVSPQGQLGLPPDNQAHRVSLSTGYNLGETTRLNGVFSYGLMLQDDAFLPYTITTALADVDPTLPRQSLDGKIQNLLVDLSASTRPMPGLDLRARYRYDDRNNDTPRDTYLPVHSDTLLQSSSEELINLPYSSTQNLVNLDASYLLLPESSTKLSVGYDFEQKDRTFTEVETTRDHTGRVKIQSTPFESLSGSLKYAHTIRKGSGYQGNAPYLASHVGLAADEFENLPQLRKFYLADRNSDTVSASLTLLPHEQVSIGLNGNYTMYDYTDGTYGLRNHNLADATVTAYAFFTHERQNFDQDSIQFTSGTVASALADDPTLRWSADTRDRVNTVGTRLEWKNVADLFDLEMDYSYSRAVTSFHLSAGSVPDTTPLPDLISQLHSLGISAKYNVQDNMSIRFGYRFETLSTEDFALDGVNVNTVGLVLGLGQSSPDYSAHVVAVSMAYQF